MSDDNNNSNNDQKYFKLGDDLIAIVRELVQVTLATGTNIVDHLRAVVCKIDPETGKVIPTEEYIEGYNAMIDQLAQAAEKAMAEQESLAGIETVSREDLENGAFKLGLVDDNSDNSDDDNGGTNNSDLN